MISQLFSFSQFLKTVTLKVLTNYLGFLSLFIVIIITILIFINPKIKNVLIIVGFLILLVVIDFVLDFRVFFVVLHFIS